MIYVKICMWSIIFCYTSVLSLTAFILKMELNLLKISTKAFASILQQLEENRVNFDCFIIKHFINDPTCYEELVLFNRIV